MIDEKKAVDEGQTLEQTEDAGNLQTDEAEFVPEAAAEVQPEQHQDNLAEELNRAREEAKENYNRYLRVMADMENLRRRVRKEQEDLAQYASLKVVEALLPALDNFERALSQDKETLTVDSLLQGVEMVYRQMKQVLEQEGLTPIESLGKPFDPNLHQAVMQAEDPEQESGVVVEEFQKGYLFKDRIIRPSMVKVNK